VDLGPAFLLALAERDRLHEQPDKLLALLEPLGRVLLDLVQALPEREEPGVRGVRQRRPFPALGEFYLNRGQQDPQVSAPMRRALGL